MSNTLIGFILVLTLQQAATATPLTLSEALQRAYENAPGLQAAQLQTQAAEKLVTATGLRADPKLEIEAEGLGENDRQEYTLKLEQTIQRGDKRNKARAVSQYAVEIADQSGREIKQALDTEIRRVFIELMTQQKIDAVRSEQEQLGRAFIEVAKQRLAAGGGSELEVVQAELAFEEIKLAQTCCFGDLKAEKEKLASLLNVPITTIDQVTGDFNALPPLDHLTVDESLPTLKMQAAQIDQTRAQATYAQSQDTPDLSLGAGIKHEPTEDVNTFVLSASFPLNFSRSGRTLRAASLLQAEAMQAELERSRRSLQQELNSLLALYNGTRLQVEISQNRLIPKAQQAYDVSRAGYESGRFSWLELIQAQQHLADIRIRHIELLREAQLIRAALSKFTNEGI